MGPGRVEFRPWSSYTDYLATYREVDAVLDPFPFSGSATTCESLWMGVPVITMPGETFASRHSLCHLTSVGLTELIVRDPDGYVELAVSLTGDPALLAYFGASCGSGWLHRRCVTAGGLRVHFEALMTTLA